MAAPTESTQTLPPTEPVTEAPTEPPHNWQPGYVASLELSAEYYSEGGAHWGTLIRGTQVDYEITPDGVTAILIDDNICYLGESAYIVSDAADCIPAHTLYVRTAVNLRDSDGKLLDAFIGMIFQKLLVKLCVYHFDIFLVGKYSYFAGRARFLDYLGYAVTNKLIIDFCHFLAPFL
jgi:hypothetical protein